MVNAAAGSCALCTDDATITNWGPIQEWLTVEGCSCGGFFVWTGIWHLRLPKMSEAEREGLAARVRDWRASGREAWISTADGTLRGRLVVFPERPAVSTESRPQAPDSILTPRSPR